MATASLGGVPFVTSPEEISWNFKMKVVEKKTIGGKVIQIIGTTLGDMTVVGSFGRGNRKRGDEAGWEAQDRFKRNVAKWTRASGQGSNPIPFVFPDRDWNFQVFIKNFQSAQGPIVHANDEINPKWVLTLFVVDAGSQEVIKGIRDKYIQRLMAGVGWAQTDYNGPTQAEVDQLVGGRQVGEYLAEQAQHAFDNPVLTPFPAESR